MCYDGEKLKRKISKFARFNVGKTERSYRIGKYLKSRKFNARDVRWENAMLSRSACVTVRNRVRCSRVYNLSSTVEEYVYTEGETRCGRMIYISNICRGKPKIDGIDVFSRRINTTLDKYLPCTFPKTSNSTDSKGSWQRGSSAAILSDVKRDGEVCGRYSIALSKRDDFERASGSEMERINSRAKENDTERIARCEWERSDTRTRSRSRSRSRSRDASPLATTHLAGRFLLRAAPNRSPNRSPYHIDIDLSAIDRSNLFK